MDGLNKVYTAVPMGREAKATEQMRWQQLTAAVLELRKHVEALEKRVMALENPMKASALIEMEHEKLHVQS